MNIQEWIEAGKPWNVILHGDCMELMEHIEDKSIELACVDPPYGIGDRLSDGGGKLKNTPMAVLYRESTKWDNLPDKKYFEELFRISKNQIICGGNYFDLPPSRCMICWDKKQSMPTLSAWELLWTSFDKPSKIYKYSSTDNNRFHPTQKPVALYRWLLQNYAKPGDKIIDTHSGSGSLACACHLENFDFLAIEKDEDYYKSSVERLDTLRSQGRLF